MVASWLPDPPVGQSGDEISTSSVPGVLFVDSDSDDQEANIIDGNLVENDGYRLLNNYDAPVEIGLENDEDYIIATDNRRSSDPIQTTEDSSIVINDTESVSTNSTVSNSSQMETGDPRDIDVDYDQVRAVMSRITLPASAVPSWASTVPDSDWCAFLQNRIRTLQRRDDVPTEAKSHVDDS